MLKPQPTSISTSRPVFRSLCTDLKSFNNTETWTQIFHGLNELWPSSSDTHLRLTDSELLTDTHYKHIHVLRETETHSRSGSQADTHGKCRHHLRGPRGSLAAALLCSPFLSSPKASSFARHSKYNLHAFPSAKEIKTSFSYLTYPEVCRRPLVLRYRGRALWQTRQLSDIDADIRDRKQLVQHFE